MNKIIIFLTVVLLFASCASKYSKLLRSSDSNKKFEAAMQYYKAEDYVKARELFESVLAIFKGTEKDEQVNYYLAYCYLKLEENISAGYFFKSFVNNFPSSEFVQECQFNAGWAYYNESPKYYLDQTYTKKAIEEFQVYLNRYTDAPKKEDCNKYIGELREKLERKAYDNARLYHKMDEHKAAIIALKNCLNDFPDTKYREELLFLVLKSSYNLAEKSIEKKQFDRYEDTIDEYYAYIDEYPNGSFTKEAIKFYNKSELYLKKYK